MFAPALPSAFTAAPPAAPTAVTGTVTGTEAPARVAFEYDNDLFAGTDRDYTGGLRFAWSPAGGGVTSTLFTLAQDAWTPEDTDAASPPAGQHPYAGWLYLSAARATAAGEGAWSRYVSLGVLGPAAGAEAVQDALHEATGSDPVQGWDSQRGDRVALQLGLRRDASALRRDTVAGPIDLGVHVGAALGTVTGYLHAGASLRLGRGTTRTVGPADTVPGAPDFAAAFAPGGARYVHLGIGVRAVGWDQTLEAGEAAPDAPVRDVPTSDVRAEPLVADLRVGAVAAFGRLRVAYTYALRTREYRTGRPTHAFGSLNLAWTLR